MTKELQNEKREVFPRRLQDARKICGLSQAELVARMRNLETLNAALYKAVSTTAIERYENGVMFPDDDAIMLTLAQALSTTTDNLTRPLKVEVDMSKFEFRKKSKLGKKQIERIKLTAKKHIENYVEIEELTNEVHRFNGNLHSMAIRTADDARNAAIQLRKQWQLGTGPINQPIDVLEAHGVKVIEVDEDVELFDGTSNMVEGIPVVVLNKREDATNPKHCNCEERRRLTLWHEFGHMFLNIPDDITGKERENLCNIFASEMILPAGMFRTMIGDRRTNINPWELRSIQHAFGISVRAQMMKAMQMGIITEGRHKWFCISLNQNDALRQFVDKSVLPTQHSSRYERLVCRALATKVISEEKAADMLDMPIAKLKQQYAAFTL